MVLEDLDVGDERRARVRALDEIVRENEVLNAKTLPKIRMPNRDGFVADPRPDVKESES